LKYKYFLNGDLFIINLIINYKNINSNSSDDLLAKSRREIYMQKIISYPRISKSFKEIIEYHNS